MSYPKQEVAAQKVKSDNRRLVSFLICIHMHKSWYPGLLWYKPGCRIHTHLIVKNISDI